MAKKDNKETRTTIDNLHESLSSVEQKVESNKKIIVWAVVAIAVVAVAIIGYLYLVRKPAIQTGNDNIGKADLQLVAGNDSIALKQYQAVADNDGYDAANRAALQAAILLYKDGKYQEALAYADKFSGKNTIIDAGAESLKGDCYVNLNKLDDALKCYEAAVKASDKNPFYTPYFMMKQARVYDEKKDYAKEAEIYQKIKAEYPNYGPANNIDVDAYIERANALAGK